MLTISAILRLTLTEAIGRVVLRRANAKQQGTRATIVTDVGKQQFHKHFGIQVNEG